MEKKLHYFTGDITLKSAWDCDLGDITAVYDEEGNYCGEMNVAMDKINEDNFDEYVNMYNLNL